MLSLITKEKFQLNSKCILKNLFLILVCVNSFLLTTKHEGIINNITNHKSIQSFYIFTLEEVKDIKTLNEFMVGNIIDNSFMFGGEKKNSYANKY